MVDTAPQWVASDGHVHVFNDTRAIAGRVQLLTVLEIGGWDAVDCQQTRRPGKSQGRGEFLWPVHVLLPNLRAPANT
jgi:hypothetical protein